MSVLCYISFDNGTGVYSGGETVSGVVTVLVSQRLITSGIHITLVGRSKVNWTESSTFQSPITYHAKEVYFNNRTYLAGEETGQLFELEEQTYNFNYTSLLPQRLPSSFIDEHGYIEYFIRITLEGPNMLSNETFQQGFTVIHNLDLNSDPRYRMPELRQKDKTLSNFCFNRGKLLVKLTTPCTGYVPGQSISLKCFIKNRTTNYIDIVVGLEQLVSFTSESPCTKTKSTNKTVVKKSLLIESFNDKEFRETLLIPSIPPSTKDTCKCIEISYYIYAKVYPGIFLRNLLVIIPVTIGAIPFYEILSERTAESTALPTTSTGLQRGPTIFSATAPVAIPESPDTPLLTTPEREDLPPSYSSFRPPSYRDAVVLLKIPRRPSKTFLHKKNSTVEQKRSEQFVPKYPVYENFTPFAPSPDRDDEGINI